MSRLLVSVRNKQEAIIARRAGVSIIDVKEPNNGPLGAASIETVKSIADVCGDSIELSVALGELVDVPKSLDFVNTIPNLGYVKLGLSKTPNVAWRDRWLQAMSAVRPSIHRVLVAYADTGLAGSPAIDELVEFGIENNLSTFLIDTFHKKNGNLFAHQSVSAIGRLICDATEAGMDIAIAGSIDKTAVSTLAAFEPTIIAVRGAVCQTDRTGMVDYDKIVSFRACLAESNLSGAS